MLLEQIIDSWRDGLLRCLEKGYIKLEDLRRIREKRSYLKPIAKANSTDELACVRLFAALGCGVQAAQLPEFERRCEAELDEIERTWKEDLDRRKESQALTANPLTVRSGEFYPWIDTAMFDPHVLEAGIAEMGYADDIKTECNRIREELTAEHPQDALGRAGWQRKYEEVRAKILDTLGITHLKVLKEQKVSAALPLLWLSFPGEGCSADYHQTVTQNSECGWNVLFCGLGGGDLRSVKVEASQDFPNCPGFFQEIFVTVQFNARRLETSRGHRFWRVEMVDDSLESCSGTETIDEEQFVQKFRDLPKGRLEEHTEKLEKDRSPAATVKKLTRTYSGDTNVSAAIAEGGLKADLRFRVTSSYTMTVNYSLAPGRNYILRQDALGAGFWWLKSSAAGE